MNDFYLAANKRRFEMMVVLDGCKPLHTVKSGNHPKKHKPAVCAEIGGREKSYREYKMCLRKERYTTQGEATRAIGWIHKKRPDEKLRSYFCDYCGGWHLTHQE